MIFDLPLSREQAQEEPQDGQDSQGLDQRKRIFLPRHPQWLRPQQGDRVSEQAIHQRLLGPHLPPPAVDVRYNRSNRRIIFKAFRYAKTHY